MTFRRVALLLSLAPIVALAGEPKAAAPKVKKAHVDCKLQQKSDDLVFKGQDVTIGPDTRADAVLVIDGNVTVQPGAQVNVVLVSNGNATVQAGAQVKKSVITVGGVAKVAQRGDVKESVITIGDGLHIDGKDGRIDLNLSVDGQDLGRKMAAELIREVRGCELVD